MAEPATETEGTPRARFRSGVHAAVPFAIAGALLGVSFGVVARDAGFSAAATIVMSAVVNAGAAQFAALTILTQGGSVGAGVLAAGLMNSRFLPMGAAIGPSLPGSALARGAQGQAVVDASWALAGRGDGTYDRWLLFGSTAIQWVGWAGGTAIGALGAGALHDPEALGLDALYPAFFVALLIGELRDRPAIEAAALGSLIALVLVPFAPAGIPVLAASAAAFAGLRHRRSAAGAR